jgi:hypothetical protein
MADIAQYKKNTLHRFLRKNLLYYLIPNIILNTLIPYFSFTNLHAVQLFEGPQNLARFLLPMSLLLPFIITFDILNKTILLSGQGHVDIKLNKNFKKNKFIFQMAASNGFCTALSMLALMFCLYFSFPRHYYFDGAILAIVVGLLAGLFSFIFTYLPVKKLRKIALDQSQLARLL